MEKYLLFIAPVLAVILFVIVLRKLKNLRILFSAHRVTSEDLMNKLDTALAETVGFRKILHVNARGFVRPTKEALLEIPYPPLHKVRTELLNEASLAEIATYDVANTIFTIARESDEKYHLRRRYITALAALYDFDIPHALLDLSPATRQCFEIILQSMTAKPVSILTMFEDDFPLVSYERDYNQLIQADSMAKNEASRLRYYQRIYAPIESKVIQTLLQQSSGMIHPFWPTFEKRLRKNMGPNALPIFSESSDVLRSVVTVVAFRHGLPLPDSYIRQAPLTALLASVDPKTLPKEYSSFLKRV